MYRPCHAVFILLDWLFGIVLMIGGEPNYVEILDAVLEFIPSYHPTSDKWSDGTVFV